MVILTILDEPVFILYCCITATFEETENCRFKYVSCSVDIVHVGHL